MNNSGLVLMIIPVFLVCFGLLWSGIVFLSAHLSGWTALARHYPGSQQPAGQSWHWSSATFSWFASYRNILTVSVSPSGLYMRPIFVFRIGHEPLLIPWNAITDAQRTSLFFTQAFRLEVMQPGSGNSKRITLYGKGLADALEGYAG